MYIKILILTIVSLFSCLSSGMCPPDDFGSDYDYISPEIDTQLDVDQVFIVKNTGLTMTDSFPFFCSDEDDKLTVNTNLNPNQTFMIIGEFINFIYEADVDGSVLSDKDFTDGYFKVALIKNGVVDMTNAGWIYMDDFDEMKTNGKIEKITGQMVFQVAEK